MLKFRSYIVFSYVRLKIQQSCTFLIKITKILPTFHASKILCVAIKISFRLWTVFWYEIKFKHIL